MALPPGVTICHTQRPDAGPRKQPPPQGTATPSTIFRFSSLDGVCLILSTYGTCNYITPGPFNSANMSKPFSTTIPQRRGAEFTALQLLPWDTEAAVSGTVPEVLSVSRLQ